MLIRKFKGYERINPSKRYILINQIQGIMPCIKGTGGEEVLDFAKEKPGELVIFKKSFDGFLNPEFKKYLKKNNKKHLMIAGMQTSFCVLANALSAFQRGYILSLVEDCVADDNRLVHDYVTQSYNNLIFNCISSKEILQLYPQWQEELRETK